MSLLRNFSIAVGLLFCALGFVHASAATADVSNFTLSGVRLGMSLDEARNSMAAFYKVKPAAIKQIDVTRQPKRVQLVYRDSDSGITVSLIANAVNPNSENFKVYDVFLSFPTMTAQDKANLAESTKSRFGRPSVSNETNSFWCSKIQVRGRDEACAAVNDAYLRLFDGTLNLVDKGIENEQTARLENTATKKAAF